MAPSLRLYGVGIKQLTLKVIHARFGGEKHVARADLVPEDPDEVQQRHLPLR